MPIAPVENLSSFPAVVKLRWHVPDIPTNGAQSVLVLECAKNGDMVLSGSLPQIVEFFRKYEYSHIAGSNGLWAKSELSAARKLLEKTSRTVKAMFA